MGNVGPGGFEDVSVYERLALIQADAARHRRRKRKRRRRPAKYVRPTQYVRREERVRDLLQVISHMPNQWESSRSVPWLVNPRTGRQLEADCLCTHPIGKWSGCIFEVDGAFHGKFNKYFHPRAGDFQRMRERDHTKSRLAALHNCALIRVPSRAELCDSQLALFLTEQLSKLLTSK